MVKHALREGLAASVGSQVSSEAEGLVDGQIGLHHEHGGAGGLGLLEHVASPPVEHSIDTSYSVLWALVGENKISHVKFYFFEWEQPTVMLLGR